MVNVFTSQKKKFFSFLRHLNFCPDCCGLTEKQLDKKANANFKIHDIIHWETNNCNTYIAKYLKSRSNQTLKFDQLIEYNIKNVFLGKSYPTWCAETARRPFSKTYQE